MSEEFIAVINVLKGSLILNLFLAYLLGITHLKLKITQRSFSEWSDGKAGKW